MAACFCGNATISDRQVFWIEEVANLRGSLPGLPVAATLYELQRRAQMERLLYAAWPRATSFSAKTTADTYARGGVAANPSRRRHHTPRGCGTGQNVDVNRF
jgi:hypothetical protein